MSSWALYLIPFCWFSRQHQYFGLSVAPTELRLLYDVPLFKVDSQSHILLTLPVRPPGPRGARGSLWRVAWDFAFTILQHAAQYPLAPMPWPCLPWLQCFLGKALPTQYRPMTVVHLDPPECCGLLGGPLDLCSPGAYDLE